MEEEKKIKEIYGCNYIETDEELYPLQNWYNQLLDKRVSEIDVPDVLRMIRQHEFIDIAVIKAIDYLKENPFVGDMYEGEMLYKLSKIDSNHLKSYSDEIKVILSNALIESKRHEWLCEEEKEEFREIINYLEKIV